jgi:acyl-CoA dehydrogenase
MCIGTLLAWSPLFNAGYECGAAANIAKLLAFEAGWHAAEATVTTYGGLALPRIRHRAQMTRDPPLPDSTHLD